MALPGTGYTVRVVGAEVADAFLRKMGEAAVAAVRNKIQVGSFEPYSYGIETGRFRGGRLARRAGGAFYLRRAFNSTVGRARPEMISALRSGDPRRAGEVLYDVATRMRDMAESLAPRRSGKLGGSIRVILATGSGNGGFNVTR